MAKSQAERSLAATAKRRRLGEEELRHPVQTGTRALLAELMRWHGVSEKAEALQLLILNAHALGLAHPAGGHCRARRAPAGHQRGAGAGRGSSRRAMRPRSPGLCGHRLLG